MYSIDDFQDIHADGLSDIDLSLDGIREENASLGISRATFRYGRDWRPRICLEVEVSRELFNFSDAKISLGCKFPDQDFISLSRQFQSKGGGLITLAPKSEPFTFGEPGPAVHAQCIVINGPSNHFEGKPLSWEAEGLTFEYSLFPGIQKALSDKERMAGASTPTGVLSVSAGDQNTLDRTEVWKIFHRASKVLTFASGIGVGVGHIEFTRTDGERFWLLGFSKWDRFPIERNWYDIEMVSDFPQFASAYHSYLIDEPSTLPLLSSSDFYRASNSIKKSSSEISLIASYSALEILTHHILREDAHWTKDLLTRAKFEDKLRAAAAFVGLDADPLEHANFLHQFLKSRNKMDGYAALSEARNSIVHSEKSFRVDGFQLLNLWLMSQWLVEIFTFYLIGYKGSMADRRRLSGWRGEGTGDVPIRNHKLTQNAEQYH